MSEAKRENYISWDDYFMAMALLSSKRSKDPSTQVGACIVNFQKKIVGLGYNGFPKGCSDDYFPWGRIGTFLDIKYSYVCHAELNAVLNSTGSDLNNCTIYSSLFPCNECAKVIIQSGIKEVIYLSNKYKKTYSVIAAKRMFNKSSIKYRQLIPAKKVISISMSI